MLNFFDHIIFLIKKKFVSHVIDGIVSFLLAEGFCKKHVFLWDFFSWQEIIFLNWIIACCTKKSWKKEWKFSWMIFHHTLTMMFDDEIVIVAGTVDTSQLILWIYFFWIRQNSRAHGVIFCYFLTARWVMSSLYRGVFFGIDHCESVDLTGFFLCVLKFFQLQECDKILLIFFIVIFFKNYQFCPVILIFNCLKGVWWWIFWKKIFFRQYFFDSLFAIAKTYCVCQITSQHKPTIR